MKNYPCQGCTQRCIGCHSTCTRYLQTAQEHRTQSEHMRQAKKKASALNEVMYRNKNVKFCAW